MARAAKVVLSALRQHFAQRCAFCSEWKEIGFVTSDGRFLCGLCRQLIMQYPAMLAPSMKDEEEGGVHGTSKELPSSSLFRGGRHG